jgi:uncharacterized protein YcfJ
MRSIHRPLAIVAGSAAVALLAACTNPVMAPQGGYNTGASPTYAGGSTGGVQAAPSAATEFGRVTDIQTVSMGQTSATNPQVRNAIVGGIIGAVVGNAVGKNVDGGSKRSGVTALGAAGGAAVGSQIGAGGGSTASSGAAGPAYRVTVQTDQGAWRTYEVGALGDLRVGDRVRVDGGVIYRS